MPTPPTARAAMDAFGLDALCEAIADEQSLTSIARGLGITPGSMLAWVDADPERSARVREARRQMAAIWDERAERLLSEADDEFGLKKAKELAHHYRWRAKAIAPKEYGDRLDHSGTVTWAQLVEQSGAPKPQG